MSTSFSWSELPGSSRARLLFFKAPFQTALAPFPVRPPSLQHTRQPEHGSRWRLRQPVARIMDFFHILENACKYCRKAVFPHRRIAGPGQKQAFPKARRTFGEIPSRATTAAPARAHRSPSRSEPSANAALAPLRPLFDLGTEIRQMRRIQPCTGRMTWPPLTGRAARSPSPCRAPPPPARTR